MEIDEIKLREIIREEISLLAEMSLPRKQVKQNTFNLIGQVIENWCLVRYAVSTNTHTDLLNRWKIELRSYLLKILSNKIKGNDSYQSRLKLFTEVFEGYEFQTDINVVDNFVSSKFIEEGISIKSEEYLNTLRDFMKKCGKIIVFLALGDKNNVNGFIESI